jgi:hypothetical protein
MDHDPEAPLSRHLSLPSITIAGLMALQLSCAGAPPPTIAALPSDSAKGMLRDGLVFALQVEGDSAIALLHRVRSEDLDSTRAAIRGCVLARLEGGTLPPMILTDTFVGQLLRTYQGYWRRALRKERSTEQNDSRLLVELNSLLRKNGGASAPSIDSIEVILKPMILAHGYHPLLGVTSPLRELMLWQDETEAHYEVALPQGAQPVTVVFMDRFASLGWAGFATCDRYHTGGWTKPDRLYAVQSAYDTTSEDFRVSYLAHEGQHFWDTQHLPENTPAWRLEYRAKLVELAVGKESVYELLTQFAGNTSVDTTVPHSFANGLAIRGMAAKLFPGGTTPPQWREVPVARINTTAAELLRADSTPPHP